MKIRRFHVEKALKYEFNHKKAVAVWFDNLCNTLKAILIIQFLEKWVTVWVCVNVLILDVSLDSNQ